MAYGLNREIIYIHSSQDSEINPLAGSITELTTPHKTNIKSFKLY